MTCSGALVQVARPSMENSLAEGLVGIAWRVGHLAVSIDLYVLEPEEPDEQIQLEGLLFSAEELEVLP